MEKLKTIKNLEGKEGKEEEKKIRNLVAIGLTSPEIAKRLNYSSSTIRNIKFQLGIYSKEQILNLAELYSDKEVAKIARIDEETVKQVKKAYKTKIPKRLSEEDEKK